MESNRLGSKDTKRMCCISPNIHGVYVDVDPSEYQCKIIGTNYVSEKHSYLIRRGERKNWLMELFQHYKDEDLYNRTLNNL